MAASELFDGSCYCFDWDIVFIPNLFLAWGPSKPYSITNEVTSIGWDHNGITSSGGSGMQGAPSLIRSQLLWSISTGSCKVLSRDIFPLLKRSKPVSRWYWQSQWPWSWWTWLVWSCQRKICFHSRQASVKWRQFWLTMILKLQIQKFYASRTWRYLA